MKIDILMIVPFTHLPGEPKNGRFHYLAQQINRSKAEVEIVTTDFSHGIKTHRSVSAEDLARAGYRVTLIHEPGYKKSISVSRYVSHHVLGRNLNKYLRTRQRPDVVYCAVPPPNVAKVAAKYARAHDVPFVIDIQDIWPDAFKMFFDKPLVSDVLFYPVRREVDYVYASADHIIAVSQTYAERGLRASKKCNDATVVFLGTELDKFDRLAIEYAIDTSGKKELWLAYVGTLSHSYDVPCVIDALSLLKKQGITDIKFIVMGEGPLRTKFEAYADTRDVWVEFTGRLSYGEMVGLLSACDIAVNPIVRGSGGSILNKHADYAAAGLPVVNTQESPEYRKLVEQHYIGFNCETGNAYDLADKILTLYQRGELRKEMGNNHRLLAEEMFDRKHTYAAIINLLMQICEGR